MDTAFFAAALLWGVAGVASTDDALIKSLGHPQYQIREWSQKKLHTRANDGQRSPTVERLETVLVTEPNYEIRRRAALVLGASFRFRLQVAYTRLDELMGRSYPCRDAVYYDFKWGNYRYPDGGFTVPGLPDDVPQWLSYSSGQQWPGYRYASRESAARELATGVAESDVVRTLRLHHHIDAIWYIRQGRSWDQPDLVPYVLAILRWDVSPPTPPVAPAPTSVPQAMPAP